MCSSTSVLLLPTLHFCELAAQPGFYAPFLDDLSAQEHAMRLEKKAAEDAKKSANAAQLASSRAENELSAEKATVADLRSSEIQ